MRIYAVYLSLRILGMVLISALAAHAQPTDIDALKFARGLTLFQQNCAACHGDNGDGTGSSAADYTPRPRNLTLGVFKFRSTAIGDYPSQADVVKTIRNGITGSYGASMPAFGFLTEDDLSALTEVIRFLADIDEFGTSVDVAPRSATPDLAKGATLYNELGCVDCHGVNGDGKGTLAPQLSDSEGFAITPADFRVGQFKGGNAPQDVWFRIYTGLSGTPMPGFGINTEQDDIWAVTEYILQFSE